MAIQLIHTCRRAWTLSSFQIPIMNSQIRSRFSLTCTNRWFQEDDWLSSTANQSQTAATTSETAEHEISAERVEGELRQAKFEIVSRQDHFIEA